MLYVLPPSNPWAPPPLIWQDSGTGGSLDEEETTKNARRLSECYFGGRGMPPAPKLPPSTDIHLHLQSMFCILRPEETLKMAVKLESAYPGRTRYLVVVSRAGTEESCLLGIDCNHQATLGLVLRVLAHTHITLDGDGGFSVSICGRQHIFKPVSVQAMWSALQTLHKVSGKARERNFFLGGGSHDWVTHYEARVTSDRSCLNQWHAMDSLQSRRPPSPHRPGEREETERVIRAALKEIMMTVDLDEVTSKQVRTRLEEALGMDLASLKSFIDEEMLIILGQMDEATQIFPHVYLGSEWNASNLDELTKNGVCHILNVTREIDNFFPGMFDYLNIRVYDDEKTDLLKHWDDTFKYITKAKKEGSKVLVHCKMGVSRSASVVIAYAMKAYSWDLKKALAYVQDKRNCIKPNSNFIAQLETYEGILDAMKNKEKLQRSKSETNLKWREAATQVVGATQVVLPAPSLPREVPGPPPCEEQLRPKSWSPDHATATTIFTSHSGEEDDDERVGVVPPPPPPLPPSPQPSQSQRNNVRMPCPNGLAYSVSQNKAFHLPSSSQAKENGVRHRVNALECERRRYGGGGRRRGLVLNLTSQFEEEKRARDVFSSQLDTVFDTEETSQRVGWYECSGGLVRSLRREFEARSREGSTCSLPSSPIDLPPPPAPSSPPSLYNTM